MTEASHALPLQLFPDIGVAAYLRNAWGDDLPFRIRCINDRKPLYEDEELVIVASPDPQSVAECMKINDMVPSNVPMVLFNPRLVSGALVTNNTETLLQSVGCCEAARCPCMCPGVKQLILVCVPQRARRCNS